MDNRDRMAREAANRLQGTCLSIHDLGAQFKELQNDDVFCRTLDSLVFCCECCDWWFNEEDKATDTLSGFLCYECDGDEFE